MPGEIAGWMPSQTKKMQPLTLATIGFGQSIMVTPLQMIRAYASLSNGGYLVEPTLIRRGDKEAFKRLPILKAAAARDATDALVQVTEGEKGTGHLARVEGYLIAGKTGTAQTVDPRTRKYSTSRHIASFIGYPVGVKQPITILTLLDNPRGVYYAGQTAAPLFSTVLKQVVSRFSIPTTEKIRIPLVESTPSPAPVRPVQDADTVQVAQSSAEIIEQSLESTKEVNLDHPVMPSVIGLTPQEAMRALRPFLPKVQVHGFGLIRKQSPESGSMIAKGLDVTLHLGE
jgi:membrane peptidoglycan carboxypeptidase